MKLESFAKVISSKEFKDFAKQQSKELPFAKKLENFIKKKYLGRI